MQSARRTALASVRRIPVYSNSLSAFPVCSNLRLQQSHTIQPRRLFSSTQFRLNDDKKLSPEGEAGTPVGEVLARDAEGAEAAPEVVKLENEAVRNTLGDAAPELPDEEAIKKDIEEAMAEEDRAEQIEDIDLEESLEKGTPVEELMEEPEKPSAEQQVYEPIILTEEEKAAREADRERHRTMSEISAHLVNLRVSGLSLEDYIAKTGTTVLNDISDTVKQQRFKLEAKRAALEAKRVPGEPLPFDSRYQLAKVRKSGEFNHLPLPEDEIVSHLVNIIMRDGKKTVAQRIVNEAFIIVRMRLNQDPISVLRYVVEKTQPLVKINRVKKGAKVIMIPKALTPRQRASRALLWLLDEARKRPSPSYGVRLGDAIVALRRGCDTGTSMEKKDAIHKIAMENRATIPTKGSAAMVKKKK
ncbi:mitochondrial 37S ribosomal protein uS7m [Kockiozyma suomiensis]|uniref:mitochondrial 37S ribosomal protein uS7m n=1 Tax=Kockiozyma suomiensis TaxID=1337062 RepID=UPI003342EB85